MADQAPGGAGGWGAGQPGGQQQWGAGAVPPAQPQTPATWGGGYAPPPAQPAGASPWHTVWKALLIIVTLLYLGLIIAAFAGGTSFANSFNFNYADSNIGAGSVGLVMAIIVGAVFFVPWALVSLVLFLLMSATRAPAAPVVFTGTTGGYQPPQGYGYTPAPQGYAQPQAYVPPPPGYAPPAQAAGPAKSCPRCGAVVPYDASSCPTCGYSPGA